MSINKNIALPAYDSRRYNDKPTIPEKLSQPAHLKQQTP
jgi:hypothetical protein